MGAVVVYTQIPYMYGRTITTFINGCIVSHHDVDGSKMWYAAQIARPSELSDFWTHIADPEYARRHTYLSVREHHLALSTINLEARSRIMACATNTVSA